MNIQPTNAEAPLQPGLRNTSRYSSGIEEPETYQGPRSISPESLRSTPRDGGPVSADVFPTPELANHPHPCENLRRGTDKGARSYSPGKDIEGILRPRLHSAIAAPNTLPPVVPSSMHSGVGENSSSPNLRRSARIRTKNTRLRKQLSSTSGHNRKRSPIPLKATSNADEYDAWNLNRLGPGAFPRPGPAYPRHTTQQLHHQPRCKTKQPATIPSSNSSPPTDSTAPRIVTYRNTHQKNSIIVLQWNINGFYNNLGDLTTLVDRHQPCYIALQELHNVTETQLNKSLKGRYTWITSYGSGFKSAGLGIRKGLPFTRLSIVARAPIVGIMAEFPRRMAVVSAYIPCNTARAGKIIKEALRDVAAPVLFAGDVNGHHKKWGSESNNSQGMSVFHTAERLDLAVLNDGSPTFWRGRAESAIDVTLVDARLLQHLSWKINDDPLGSDHFPIFVNSRDTAPVITRRAQWKYDEADWIGFGAGITDGIAAEDPSSLTELVDVIHRAAKDHVPRTSTTCNPRGTKWWNTQTDEATAERKKALRDFSKQKKKIKKLQARNEPIPAEDLVLLEELQAAFAVERSRARSTIKKAKRDSWQDFLDGIHSDQSSQLLWKKINAVSGKRRQQEFCITYNKQTTRDPNEVAEHLSEYFAQLSAYSEYPTPFKSQHPQDELTSIIIPEADEDDDINAPFLMHELNYGLERGKGKSLGPDDVGYPLLRNLPESGEKRLLELINKEWSMRSIPTQWRHSLVIPIPKKEHANGQVASFRPISLTCCTGKLMERMVNRRLMDRLNESSWFSHRQHAFRPGRGVGSYFGDLAQILEEAEDQHLEIAALDLEKAYNRTWTPEVIHTLIRKGFGGNILHFLVNVLKNRTFQVCIGNHRSSIRSEETGVAQGSVIAVTLFMISMNGMEANLPGGMYALTYADDIALVSVGKSKYRVRRKLQSGVTAVAKWSKSVGFSLSPAKCEAIHICRTRHANRQHPLCASGQVIRFRNSIRLLGAYLDRQLTFRKHITETRMSCKTRINLVKAISGRHKNCNRETILKVVQAIIVSRLTFGVELFARHHEKIAAELAPIYNTAVRISSGLLPGTPTLAMCAESGVLPFNLILQKCVLSRGINTLTRTSGSGDTVLTRTAKEIFRTITEHEFPKLSEVHWVGPAPWNRSRLKMITTLETRFTRKENFPTAVLREVSIAKLDSLTEYSKRYTDGSRDDDEQTVGFGVYGDVIISKGLPDYCSVFSAEAAAVLHAIQDPPTNNPLLIVSDCLSLIKALRCDRSEHPWVQAIQKYGEAHTYMWAPSHCGIPGNERADDLANDGREKRATSIPTTGQDLKRYIRAETLNFWRRLWQNSPASTLRKVKNLPDKWDDPPTQQDQRILSRLRVGRARFSHNMTGKGPYAIQCPICQVRFTVEHALIACPSFEQLREKHGFSPPRLREMLGKYNPSTMKHLKLFLKDANLLHQV